MLHIDNGAEALFNPGAATNFFDELLLSMTPFDASKREYDATNAWWLAEVSRVIYRLSVAEGTVLRDRALVLQDAGLTEVAPPFRGPSTCAALIRGEGFHIVAFRGTQELRDWLRNIDIRPREWEPGRGHVHSGFWNALEEVWPSLSATLVSLAGPVFFTGHSLGAALAVLAAARIDAAHRPRAVYAYGCPRSGDQQFAGTYPDVPVYRVVNNRDVVARVPPRPYKHVGTMQYVRSNGTLATNPSELEMHLDLLRDDPTHELLHGDTIPEWLNDHAPVNYAYWMQHFARR
jgi:hypothetical protein